ncbi:hypothetical protein Tco_1217127 [Tanacetum coccineum]
MHGGTPSSASESLEHDALSSFLTLVFMPAIKLRRESKYTCLSENVRLLVAGVGPLSGKGPRVIVSADASDLPQSVYVRGGAVLLVAGVGPLSGKGPRIIVSADASDLPQSVSFKLKVGGSILDVMEDLIEIGHAMGYNMKGCSKNIEAIVDLQRVTSVDIFFLEANVLFQFMQPKDISEEFFVGFKLSIDNLWDSESIILRDYFNEVRSENERFGTIFNDIGAKAFNQFISSSCLIDLPLKGLDLIFHSLCCYLISLLRKKFQALMAVIKETRSRDICLVLGVRSDVFFASFSSVRISELTSGLIKDCELISILLMKNLPFEKIFIDLDSDTLLDWAQKAKIQ